MPDCWPDRGNDMAETSPQPELPRDLPDGPAPAPRLTATDSNSVRETSLEWPVAILVFETGPLILIKDEKQWRYDVHLKGHYYTQDDLLIDSLGRVFEIVSYDDLEYGHRSHKIRVSPSARSVSLEDFRAFAVAQAKWHGLIPEEVFGDIQPEEPPIASMIDRLGRALSANWVKSDFKPDKPISAPEPPHVIARDYEPPQFTIFTVLVIMTIVAVGCSAVVSEYFGFGGLRTLLAALFTCAFFTLFVWIFIGANTPSATSEGPPHAAKTNDTGSGDSP